MKANDDIRNILFLARTYGAHSNLGLASVSLYAANSGALFPNYEAKTAAGIPAGITNIRRDKIMSWFSKHWPGDLDWPEGIERPDHSSSEDAA